MNERLDEAKKAMVKGIENVKDAASEALHIGTADAEKAKREALGENMSLGDQVASHANELTNRAQADVDATKREIR